MLYAFLAGMISSLCMVAGFFFVHFYIKVKDKFFLWFAWAFYLFAVERFFIVLNKINNQDTTYVYIIRLIGFVLILFAIYFKNRSAGPTASS